MNSFNKEKTRQLIMWMMVTSLFLIALFNTPHMYAALLGYWANVLLMMKLPKEWTDKITPKLDDIDAEALQKPIKYFVIVFAIMALLGAFINVPLWNAFFVNEVDLFRPVIGMALIDGLLVVLFNWGTKTSVENKRKNKPKNDESTI